MKQLRNLLRDERGAALIETAFALPILIALIWLLVQLGFVFRANAGIQQALGEGARFATLCVNPNLFLGCSQPTLTQVQARMQAAVAGDEMGTFTAELPVLGVSGGASYYDLRVRYTMTTSLIVYPGPTINLAKTKRVWVAS